MQIWLQQQAWWIGIILAFLFALFPKTFAGIGATIKIVIVNYWLQIGLSITIILLLIICQLLLLK